MIYKSINVKDIPDQTYQKIDFLYDGLYMAFSSNEYTTKNMKSKKSKAENISKELYEGFGLDLIITYYY